MPTKVGLRKVKDKLTAGRVMHDDGVTKFCITNNVEDKLGLQVSQLGYDNKSKTCTWYMDLDTLNKMLHTLGYQISQIEAEKIKIDKTSNKTKKATRTAKKEAKA